MAVICGTPMPATTRVVQMLPGPMPTLTQSAPALMRASVPSAVATLPAIRPTSGKCSFTRRTQRMMLALWPWAESSTSASTPAETSAPARSRMSLVTPMAAAQSSLPWLSLAEFGYFTTFSMSLMVIRPFRWNSSSTMGSFSILCRRRISFALLQRGALAAGDQALAGHHLADAAGLVLLELHVAVGDDADQPPVRVHHGHAGDTELGHQRVRLGQRVFRPQVEGGW